MELFYFKMNIKNLLLILLTVNLGSLCAEDQILYSSKTHVRQKLIIKKCYEYNESFLDFLVPIDRPFKCVDFLKLGLIFGPIILPKSIDLASSLFTECTNNYTNTTAPLLKNKLLLATLSTASMYAWHRYKKYQLSKDLENLKNNETISLKRLINDTLKGKTRNIIFISKNSFLIYLDIKTISEQNSDSSHPEHINSILSTTYYKTLSKSNLNFFQKSYCNFKIVSSDLRNAFLRKIRGQPLNTHGFD